MNISVVCVGKLKEKYWTDAVSEYVKRLGRYCVINIAELKEYKISDKPSEAEEEKVKIEEGKAILKQIKEDAYVITLEIKGKQLSSEELAEKVETLTVEGKSNIVFVIGGSLGLSPEVSQRANYKLSFSKMTFPHQMMRVVLLEQIYRSFKIIKNETYHK